MPSPFPGGEQETERRVLPGGGWLYFDPIDVRAAYRDVEEPDVLGRGDVMGFRVARGVM